MLLVPKYELLEQISAFKHAAIFRARRIEDQSLHCLKFLKNRNPSQNEINVLTHEFHLLKHFSMSGIIQVQELIWVDKIPVIVLENVLGDSLQNHVLKKVLNMNEFFSVITQLLNILLTIHQQNFLHKDFKPSNMVIDPISLQIKLIELSSCSSLSQEKLNQFTGNSLDGSLSYMPLEQTGQIDFPLGIYSDIYSLGVSAYMMLTGQLPCQMSDPLQMLNSLFVETPTPIHEINGNIPEMISKIVGRMLEKSPRQRYQTVEAVRADMTSCIDSWESSNNIATFTIGMQDHPRSKESSRNLFGREKQIQLLLNSYNLIQQQAQDQIIMISGDSGVGKTALVESVKHHAALKDTLFFQVKFNQISYQAPYSAIVVGIKDILITLTRIENPRSNEILKRLSKLVPCDRAILSEMIPEFAQIWDMQKSQNEANFNTSKIKFHNALLNFLKLLGERDRPIIVFFDNLQWADYASLKIIEDMLSEQYSKHLFFIGAYRSSEVHSEHPFRSTLQYLERHKLKIVSITVNSLTSLDIKKMLSALLNLDSEETSALASIIEDKTYGVPLYICEFLKQMNSEGVLKFSIERNKWQWDSNLVKRMHLPSSTSDLVLSQLMKLPEATLKALKLSACIGYTFGTQILTTVMAQNQYAVSLELWQAILSRFIVSTQLEKYNKQYSHANYIPDYTNEEGNLYYQFTHDRIQNAAYNLIPPEERELINLTIGNQLREDYSSKPCLFLLFHMAHHFNACVRLLTDTKDKEMVINLNLLAGKKAKDLGCYDIAYNLLQTARALLTNVNWKSNYDMARLTYLELAECCYLYGNMDEAFQHWDLALSNSKNLIDELTIYKIMMEAHMSLSQHDKVRDLGSKALSKLNIFLPSTISFSNSLWGTLNISYLMNFKGLEVLYNTPLKNSNAQFISQFFMMMLQASYGSKEAVITWQAHQNIRNHFQNGYSESLIESCIACSHIFFCERKDFNRGSKYANLVLKLFACTKESDLKTQTKISYLTRLHHWHQNATLSIDVLFKEHQQAMVNGNFLISISSLNLLWQNSFILGLPLPTILQRVQSAIGALNKANLLTKLSELYFALAIIRALMGDLPPSDATLSINTTSLEKYENNSQRAKICIMSAKYHYLIGNIDAALSASLSAETYIGEIKGQLSYIEWKVFHLLILTKYIPGNDQNKKSQYTILTKRIIEELKLWSIWCPGNFVHYYKLAIAELFALYSHDVNTIQNMYDNAIKSASENECQIIVAISNENLSRHMLRLRKTKLAEKYMLEAYNHYNNLGAILKSSLLKQEFPELLRQIQEPQSESPKETHGIRPGAHDAHDALTGLANESLLTHTFDYAISQRQQAPRFIAFLYLTVSYAALDALANDANIDDKIFSIIGQKVKGNIRKGDLAARIGKHEFIVMLNFIEDFYNITPVAQRLLDNTSVKMTIDEKPIELRSSIGISIYPEDGKDTETLIERAKDALSEADNSDILKFHFYQKTLDKIIKQQKYQELEMRNALKKNEFSLYYQPIFSANAKELLGLEVLIRWEHPTKGVISAKEFIGLAEKSNFIFSLEEWVVRKACAQAKFWQQEGFPAVPIAINLSPMQFKMHSPHQLIEAILEETQLEAKYLELELNESVLLKSDDTIQNELLALKNIGLALVINNFDIDKNNISYVRNFPVKKIKLDVSLIKSLENNSETQTAVANIINIAHKLKLTVVAVGVESLAQQNFLNQALVDGIQGMYLYPPMPKEYIEAIMKKLKSKV